MQTYLERVKETIETVKPHTVKQVMLIIQHFLDLESGLETEEED